MSIYEAFTLLGGVGLFLYGMTIMSSGLRNACGDNLRLILEKATRSKVTAVLAGIAVTVLVQSSSATDVMVIGFVSSGLMTLAQAIGVIMGANIGTTVTAQITAFNISAYAPLILFLGAVATLFIRNNTIKAFGSVVLGFGMLFQGISLMKSAIAPLAQLPAFVAFISTLSNPIVTVLFGVLFTAILQSSSSATVIFQAFAVQNIISFDTAIYLVIGAAIGSVTPNLLAALTSNRQGKRSAVLNLVFNLIRAVLIMTLITVFPGILTFIKNLSPDNIARQIANAHTLFAIIAVLALLPFTDKIVGLTEKLIPQSESEKRRMNDHRLIYLVHTDKMPPAVAIRQAHLEIIRMGKIALENLTVSIECFFEKDRDKAQLVEEGEESVDFLTHSIMSKLVELRSLDLSERNMNRLYSMIQAVDDIERISDHAENIIEYEEKLHDGRATISDEGLRELRNLCDLTVKSLSTCLNIFESEDFSLLPEAEHIEDMVDDATGKCIDSHVQRLMKGVCDPQGGVFFTDMTIDLERCSDHAINIATAFYNYPAQSASAGAATS